MSTALAASFLSGDPDNGQRSILSDHSNGQRQNSIAFICTVCSSMMGSTLMTLPWAFERAGLVASLIMISIVGVVSYYMCFLILHWGCGDFEDFSELCNHYLGTWSRHVANATSVGTCIGVCATYHVLMATTLQSVVLSIGDIMHTDWNFFCCGSENFEYFISSVIIGLCVFPLTSLRNLSWLMTLGSYGGISIVYNCIFIVSSAAAGWPHVDHHSAAGVKFVGNLADVGVFFGTLGMSLFVHSVLLNVSSRHREFRSGAATVKRDVGIAYTVAVLSYIAVGILPALCFELGSQQYERIKNGQLPQNILLAYDDSSVGGLIGRVTLLLQLLTVYPIVANVVRGQLFTSVMGIRWPGWRLAFVYSVGLVAFTTAISSVYPHPGNVVGYVGVYTAIVYMLALPMLVHVTARKRENNASCISTVWHATIFVVMTFAFLMQFIFF